MQILSAKYVFTMTGEPIVDGAVAVENGEIIDVGQEEDLLKRYTGATCEDYPNHVIMPGLINCHTHLDMSFFKDFPGDPVRAPESQVNYVDWLLANIAYKKNVTPEEQKEAISWALDECIQSGTTCVGDMSSYEGIFYLLEQKGIRAVLFPEVLSIDNAVTKDLFEAAMAVIERYMDYDSDLISVGVGPYSTYTLSRNLLRIMSQFSRSAEIPLMIHAADSFSEMEFFHDSTGDIASKLFPNIGWDELPPEHRKTPLKHLFNIGFLEAQPIIVGCTQATESDLDQLALTGSKVIITPRSHDNLQQGKAPYHRLKSKRIHTALGTDGIPSVQNLSLWDEMRAFVDMNRDQGITGQEVLELCTTKAAGILGLQDEVGHIKKGMRADLILVELDGISTQGDLMLNMIENVNNYHIKSVMINGTNVKTMS